MSFEARHVKQIRVHRHSSDASPKNKPQLTTILPRQQGSAVVAAVVGPVEMVKQLSGLGFENTFVYCC